MRTYVINLPREVERRAAIEAQLRVSGLDYHFVDGIDGQRLTDEERSALVDEAAVARFPRWLTPGMIGCMLSHRLVYELIAQAQNGPALVLEDDAVIAPQLAAIVAEMLPLVADDGLILLNFRSLKPCRLTRAGALRAGDYELLSPLDHWQPLSGLAYLLGEGAAQRMAQVSLPVRWAPDSWGDYMEAGALGSIRCALPRPVMPSLRVRSATRHGNEVHGIRDRALQSTPAQIVRQINRRRVRWLMNRVELLD